jgi:hypothetical protein
MWSLAIFSGWVREIPINWGKRDSTTKEKAKDTQNFWLFAISCGFFWEASREAEGGKRWEGGKVGRSRVEGRGAEVEGRRTIMNLELRNSGKYRTPAEAQRECFILAFLCASAPQRESNVQLTPTPNSEESER